MRQLSSALHPATLLRPPFQHKPSLNSWDILCFYHLVLGTGYLLVVVIFYVFLVGLLCAGQCARHWGIPGHETKVLL